MESRIPEEIIDEVRLRTDILAVISEYVTVQRKGKTYLGLCPFHAEKTPSFTVSPEKQIFYCFGCHTGGNVFAFLMKKENWTFMDTLKYLAEKAGITLPERTLSPQEREAKERQNRWQEIHDWAANYFNEILLASPEGEPGRQYFVKRGIEAETIRDFRLGYAPDRWDGLLMALEARGVSTRELSDAGLVLERAKAEGKYYDRFRNRVIFSILDARGRPVGFGGRVMDDSLPKYLNSPETEFFSKGRHLYGMHKAHQGLRAEGYALLAEGYMDVIALHKVGFFNAVASLGTALTKYQAKLLRRYTQKVVIVYDSDAAGTQAALRAAEILLAEGLRAEILHLEGAKDPDEFLKAQGKDAFKVSLTQTQTYVEFKYRILAQGRSALNIQEKAELVAKLAPDIGKVKSPVEREGYERFLSQELGLSLEAVQREIVAKGTTKPKKAQQPEYLPPQQDISVKNRDNIIRYVNPHEYPVVEHPTVSLGVYRAERIILRLILEDISRLERVNQILGEYFCQIPEHRAILHRIREGNTTDILHLSLKLNEEAQANLAGLLSEEVDPSKPERLLDDCIKVICDARDEEQIEELQVRMAASERSGDMIAALALLREIGERLKRGE